MSEVIKHYTASVIIISSDRTTKTLLVHHRKHGLWTQPGGHQEAHENSYQTAIRETLEETGLDITPFLPTPEVLSKEALKLPLPDYILEELIPAHGSEPEHYHLDNTYIVRLPEQAVSHNQSESSDIRWFSLEQLSDIDTFDDLRPILELELSK